MKGKNLELYKQTLSLSDLQREILVGTLLGDATIPKQLGLRKHNVKFEQKIGNKDYIVHLYEIFKDFVGTEPTIRNIRGGGAVDRQSVWFRTYRHQCFSDYYQLFYKNGVKIVPTNIENMLTVKGLAYWYMDDGHKQGNTYYLNTYAFTIEDQERLILVLQKNFNLFCSLHRDDKQYKIYIKTKSALDFKNLIFPFVVPVFLYKLHK